MARQFIGPDDGLVTISILIANPPFVWKGDERIDDFGAQLSVTEAAVVRAVVSEAPAGGLLIQCMRARDVLDRNLDTVDPTMVIGRDHGLFFQRRD